MNILSALQSGSAKGRSDRPSRYHEVYRRAQQDPVGFWGEAAQEIDWYEKAKKVFDPAAGVYGHWFVGAVMPPSRLRHGDAAAEALGSRTPRNQRCSIVGPALAATAFGEVRRLTFGAQGLLG